jgi:hypothetical protein
MKTAAEYRVMAEERFNGLPPIRIVPSQSNDARRG